MLMYKYGLSMYEHSWNETGHRFSVIVGLRGVLLRSYGNTRLYDFTMNYNKNNQLLLFNLMWKHKKQIDGKRSRNFAMDGSRD